MHNKMSFLKIINLLIFLTSCINAFAVEVPIYEFEIENYSQNIEDFLSSKSDDYSVLLIEKNLQKLKLQEFYNHYFATDPKGLSPWSDSMVKNILPLVKIIEYEKLNQFNYKKNNEHYAQNFKHHDAKWLDKITKKMQLENINKEYQQHHRAIAVNNTFARTLPEYAPDFYHFSLPGQGFPFDNLQDAFVLAGTPLYVLHFSQDKSWALVLTPDCYFAWINSKDFAYVAENFIQKYTKAAKKGLVAITKTETSILDTADNFKFLSYIGSVFPLDEQDDKNFEILIPEKDINNNAIITRTKIAKSNATIMPLSLSKQNMAKILIELKERPYGWGGAFFFNDCSSEMKNLFTPFGIWLPKNSGQQAYLNNKVDLSAYKLKERLNYVTHLAKPLTTLLYIEGHIMLYIGNITVNDQIIPMTYQNVWGLSPKNKDKRYVIGQAVFLPLLEKFAQTDISSQADKNYLKLIFIDKLNQIDNPQDFKKAFIRANLYS